MGLSTVMTTYTPVLMFFQFRDLCRPEAVTCRVWGSPASVNVTPISPSSSITAECTHIPWIPNIHSQRSPLLFISTLGWAEYCM